MQVIELLGKIFLNEGVILYLNYYYKFSFQLKVVGILPKFFI